MARSLTEPMVPGCYLGYFRERHTEKVVARAKAELSLKGPRFRKFGVAGSGATGLRGSASGVEIPGRAWTGCPRPGFETSTPAKSHRL
jgi:hypothetical protein